MHFKIFLLFAVGIFFTSLGMIDSWAQKTPNIDHIVTIKVSYAANWYSYNFAVCAEDTIIESPRFLITSDIETTNAHSDKNIFPGNCMSFGVMIHANNPEGIEAEFVSN